jgi:hypothetical protein
MKARCWIYLHTKHRRPLEWIVDWSTKVYPKVYGLAAWG